MKKIFILLPIVSFFAVVLFLLYDGFLFAVIYNKNCVVLKNNEYKRIFEGIINRENIDYNLYCFFGNYYYIYKSSKNIGQLAADSLINEEKNILPPGLSFNLEQKEDLKIFENKLNENLIRYNKVSYDNSFYIVVKKADSIKTTEIYKQIINQ